MEKVKKKYSGSIILRKCHDCGYVNESHREKEECHSCQKAFLPSQYMKKIHNPRDIEQDIYQLSEEIEEARLIRGLYVIW